MDTYDDSMAPRFRGMLAQRARELGRTLSHETDATRADGSREVEGFADAALLAALSTVDEANAGNAATELELITSALRRISEGTYGECLDCGDPIDLRRLTAVPTAAYCASCQSAHERH